MANEYRIVLQTIIDKTQLQNEIDKVSGQLKTKAKPTKIPVIIDLDQVNKQLQKQNEIKRKNEIEYIAWWKKQLDNQDREKRRHLDKQVELEQQARQKISRYKSEETRTLHATGRAMIKSKGRIGEIAPTTQPKALARLNAQYTQIRNKIVDYSNQLKALGATETSNIPQKEKLLMQIRRQREQLQDLNHQTSLASKNNQKLSSTLGNMAKKFMMWFSISQLIMKTIQVLRQMLQVVIDLDKAFTNIQMVTLGNAESIKNLKYQYNELAKSMGSTTQQIAESADNWLRSGMAINEVNKALEATVIMSKIGGIESSKATELLISAMRGYKKDASDLIGIVDKLSQVDIESASSIEDIAVALSRTANSANLAGVSFDKIISYIATIKDVTQDSAETIGNS